MPLFRRRSSESEPAPDPSPLDPAGSARPARPVDPVDAARPPAQPVRLPQRWAIILGLAGVSAAALGITVDMTTGVTAGLTITGLLHMIVD